MTHYNKVEQIQNERVHVIGRFRIDLTNKTARPIFNVCRSALKRVLTCDLLQQNTANKK